MTSRGFLHGVLLLTLVLISSGTTGDPDLWGHVRFGADMLAARTARVADTYSFTTDRPWVNHEWLAEIVMALAFQHAGAAGLNLLRIAIVACVLGLGWAALRRVPTRRRIPVLAAGTVGILLRAHPIRPQLFSLLLFAALLSLLARADEDESNRPLLLVPAVTALWVNLHGGWIVGVAVFGLWCALTAIARGWRDRARLAGILTASVAATLANPYGYDMWEFLASTVRVERPMIADWQPLYAMPHGLWAAWISACGITIAAGVSARSRLTWKYVTITALVGLMAIRVSRLDAFFALAAMLLAARALGERAADPEVSAPARRSWVLACSFAVCVLATIAIAIPRIRTVPMANAAMPDAEVAQYVRDHRLTGKVLTWFDWGQYTIWHFGEHLRVSMDGRRETVYSHDLVDAHLRFYTGTRDAWRYPDTLGADFVWIPKTLPVAAELQRRGWVPLCTGASSMLLGRRAVAPRCEGVRAQFPRVFPQL